jgi:epoxyqueuosine reductase QueG
MLRYLGPDAGLGELGRLGYLVTPEHGPCVRITTVTTDMPLIPDQPVDYGIDKFCQICKKCMKNCPSRSIPEQKTEVRGFTKWQLDADNCFKFWLSNPDKHFGCAVCMKSCPWNKKSTWYHKLSTWLVKKIPSFGYILLFMDDLFYGKHPHYNVKWNNYDILRRNVKEINERGGSVYVKSQQEKPKNG